MKQTANPQVKKCFDNYKESIFNIDHDLRFWKHFLKISIDAYSSDTDREINTAIFCVYDHPCDHIGGILKCHEKVYRTNVSELHKKSIDFITWVMNLSMLNAYNSMEILILQTIQMAYYPKLTNPVNGKKQTDNIQYQIKDFLKNNSINVDTKNNDYLIQFLKLKSPEISSFLNLKMNTDLNTRWIDYFYLISILRNVVAHCAMIVQPDIHNEIKSRAKDIFERHFEIKKNLEGFPILNPKPNNFNELIKFINSLTISIYKFAFNENDLSFIGMR